MKSGSLQTNIYVVSESSLENTIPQLKAHASQTKPAIHENGVRKEKRDPSITPRKFTRFFTPRSHGSVLPSEKRKALFDITTPTNNRNGTQSSPIRSLTSQEHNPTSFTRDLKRRKLTHSTSLFPDSLDSDACSIYGQSLILNNDAAREVCESYESSCSSTSLEDNETDSGSRPTPFDRLPTQRIKRLGERGLIGQLAELNLGSNVSSKRRHFSYPTSDWHDETAGFYSRPDDTHICTSIESNSRSIPFCVASCNTNSLVAVGDEEGQIRLLESARGGKPAFKDVFLAFRPHTNAIIDMSFSLDDSLLATASGDQTARVVDMATQTTVAVLAQHSASLKQVKFQPGAANNSVLATSSRDGSVQIWDLRCAGMESPVQQIYMPLDSTGTTARARSVRYGYAVNSIIEAHRPDILGRPSQVNIFRDGPSRGEIPGRIGDVSITAISFLPDGQQHFLLTASEANSSIKLWDIRSIHNTRRKKPAPISFTAEPGNHSQWRQFGISSINLSGDGTRLYTLCKDNTVYTYSTAHLVLGQAPELSGQCKRRKGTENQEGLGPLYGFRHKQLHATSFYVKSAIRPAKNGKAEILAVGSCDGCAVLFPTDEKWLKVNGDSIDPGTIPYQREFPYQTTQSRGTTSSGSRLNDSIRISENGTPLIQGHDREVSGLTWTFDGGLVTVGDDYLVRCWREGKDARDLRVEGEQGGRRWGCGWADVPASYDDDDE